MAPAVFAFERHPVGSDGLDTRREELGPRFEGPEPPIRTVREGRSPGTAGGEARQHQILRLEGDEHAYPAPQRIHVRGRGLLHQDGTRRPRAFAIAAGPTKRRPFSITARWPFETAMAWRASSHAMSRQ